ncbi:MAG TPA: ribosome maturation factor RimM [Balneolaceae bacterium]|nr:ribosome maturation factor RimM [Balneolaceae bacterium]
MLHLAATMLEPIENQYEKIGYIARSHGIQGEVVFIPEMYAPALFDSLDLVRLENARGDLIPARIESARVQEKGNRLSFFVKFEHVTDRTQAEKLKHTSVFAEAEAIGSLVDAEDEVIDFTTFEVRVDDTFIGSVREVIDNPAHPILKVITDDQNQLLIPFVDEYVVEVDEESQIIQCQNLDQLADL